MKSVRNLASYRIPTVVQWLPWGFAAMVLVVTAAACGGGGTDTGPSETGCTPGSAVGCPSGQVCSASGTCEPTAAVNGDLVIDAPSARACTVLLESDSARVVGATYGANVTGVLRARAPRFAVAATQSGNAAFGSSAITLEIEGAPSAVSVTKVDCYDASGSAIAGAAASVR